MKKRHCSALIPYYRVGTKVYIFLQRRDHNTEFAPGHLGLFGGGLEDGETAEEALVREITEELTIDIDLASCTHLTQYQTNKTVTDAYLYPVEPSFEDEVIVEEGECGTFFELNEALGRDDLASGLRLALEHFKRYHT